MNRKQVIETLKMENELICFNPLTGEEIPFELNINDLNRKCYDAHQEAIRLINNSIPIEWINKWVITTNMGAGRTIDRLLEDWEKENATEVND